MQLRTILLVACFMAIFGLVALFLSSNRGGRIYYALYNDHDLELDIDESIAMEIYSCVLSRKKPRQSIIEFYLENQGDKLIFDQTFQRSEGVGVVERERSYFCEKKIYFKNLPNYINAARLILTYKAKGKGLHDMKVAIDAPEGSNSLYLGLVRSYGSTTIDIDGVNNPVCPIAMRLIRLWRDGNKLKCDYTDCELFYINPTGNAKLNGSLQRNVNKIFNIPITPSINVDLSKPTDK